MIPTRAAEGNQVAQKAIAEEILGKARGWRPFDRMAQTYSGMRPGMPEAIGLDDARRWRDVGKGGVQSAAGARQPRDRARSELLHFEGEEKTCGETPPSQRSPEIEKKLMQEEEQKQQELWIAGLRQKALYPPF